MIVISATLIAKEGKESELENLLSSLVQEVKSESGVISYILHRSNDNPRKFFFYEKYKDKKSVDFHMSTPYLKKAFDKYQDLLAQPSEVDFYNEVSSIHQID